MSDGLILAWIVEYEGHAVVVFASTASAAAAIASEELEVEPVKVKCERAPSMDRYSPGPMPAELLLHTYQWQLHCHTCGDGIGHTAEQLSYAICDGPLVFCDGFCAKKYLELCDRLDNDLLAARTQIKQLCPSPRFLRWWMAAELGEIVYQFLPPGSLQAVTWRESKPTTLSCAQGDIAHLEDLRKSRSLH